MNTYATSITSAQSRYLAGLLDDATVLLGDRETVTGCEWPEAHEHVARIRREMDTMSKAEASKAIGDAIKNNKMLRDELAGLGVPTEPTISEPQYVTEVGMYRVGQQIFKVLPSRNSDRHYAKELTGFHFEGDRPVSDTDGTMKFVYAKGAMRSIRPEHRMTPEQEREFGKLIGHCVDCGKLLTDPRSIDWGKGPVCSDGYKH